jgi:transcriptional regulator with XRE-family HTH domain
MFSQTIFSERLKELRLSKNTKQSDLAAAVGITNKSISKIEKGQGVASIGVLYAIADFFGVSLDYLTGRTDSPDINK